MSVQAVVVTAVAVQVSDPSDETVQTVELGDIPVQDSVPTDSFVHSSPRILPKQLTRDIPFTVAAALYIALGLTVTLANAVIDPSPL